MLTSRKRVLVLQRCIRYEYAYNHRGGRKPSVHCNGVAKPVPAIEIQQSSEATVASARCMLLGSMIPNLRKVNLADVNDLGAAEGSMGESQGACGSANEHDPMA